MYLHHVQLAIPPGAEDVARGFWLDLVGFHEIPKPEALTGRGGLWVRSGDVEIHLGIEEPFTPAGKAHPAIVIEHLDALTTTLDANGRPASEDSDICGHRRVHVNDPFGNRIEFMSPRPKPDG